MNDFVLFAQPWYINLLIFVPFIFYWIFWENKLEISWRQLLIVGIFGIAFGFVEAAVVVYLRAAVGFLPGYMGTLSDVLQQATSTYQQIDAAKSIPQSFMTVEIFRETATIIMLAAVGILSAKKHEEQFAMFVWAFAFWDIFYYVGLWLTVGWPSSLTTNDVLFLIPVPWLAQVWYPLLISSFCIISIVFNRKKGA